MSERHGPSLYLEIENWLRARVLAGSEGDALPTEAELGAQFGVSRMTARQAVQNLAAEGLVRRQRGRGTFIAPRPYHRHTGALMSFTAEMRRRGLEASSTVLTAEVRDAVAAEQEALKLDGTRPRVVSIVRVRLADATPMAIESTVLTSDCVSVLALDLENGSLHEALTQLGRRPVRALSWISTRLASPDETKLLRLPPRSPVLVEKRIISDQEGHPIESTTTVYHPDRYVIDAVFTVEASSPAAE